MREMKLELYIHVVYNINLYISYIYYSFYPSAFVAMETRFPLSYNGKSRNCNLLLCNCSYFDIFDLELSSTNHMNFVLVIEFDWLP